MNLAEMATFFEMLAKLPQDGLFLEGGDFRMRKRQSKEENKEPDNLGQTVSLDGGGPLCKVQFCYACDAKHREWWIAFKDVERLMQVRDMLKTDPRLALAFQRVIEEDGMPAYMGMNEHELMCRGKFDELCAQKQALRDREDVSKTAPPPPI